MKVGVVKEREVGEQRVALIPEVVAKLVQQGYHLWVESGAGDMAHFSDDDYRAAGAEIGYSIEEVWGSVDVLLKVAPLRDREVEWIRPGTTLMSFLNPLGNPWQMQHLAERHITAFALECIPRTSRAQSMDALSSQAAVAGYAAVLLAASHLPRFFPMLTTAAGTIPPAKVFVIGAGVAGLQAIATARRLGAVVEAFDIRPAVKEEVQSLGAKFVEVNLEEETGAAGSYAKEVSEAAKHKTQEAIAAHVHSADVIITTAQVPGKPAPLLITERMVASMKPGSVIVDLAAEQGGNCACTEPGRSICHQRVTIIGPINLPSTMAVHASQMYAKNISTLLKYVAPKGELVLNFGDDIVDAACVTHEGQVRNPRVLQLLHPAQTLAPML
ncbi:Re/Si-specific NAD(P)(+) transhydrogenase subunit alpha [Thermosynechococcus vestitus]|uniref:NAD(P) transhydrogenase subunit alpha part 1 n=1 Tax=Thermosynechococcus vestitus (strain NIES-2133 / IAM M-273 / BP-1) TaxID=197221 RepID=Q8DL05_THEVB|nr:Re/Si-specific NAD(P)(+) transhydrogenase subunit alpha [Thermosynechococcus vestitus]BAC08245.1 pyridine nucleotide transhydrogenase alpha subunit [Thermosynechococcus vestitus BP-1]